MTTGIELIATERQRQIDVEGYKVEEDKASYGQGQLTGAAICYAVSALNKVAGYEFCKAMRLKHDEWVDPWPWDAEFDKRNKHDLIRSLVIAGALLAAEIDRIQHETDTVAAQ